MVEHIPTLDELVLDGDRRRPLREAVEKARQWYERWRGGVKNASLLLHSTRTDPPNKTTGRGQGKTHIARACLYSYGLYNGDQLVAPLGRFYTATDLIGSLDGETPVSELLGDIPLLVIDEAGAEQRIPYIPKENYALELERRWAQLIDYCYTTGIAVVVTSNLSLVELARHMGLSAWSRLWQMTDSKALIADLTGVPDWRNGTISWKN